MRILHFIQRYYPARGGAEKHLEEISNYLAAAGHQVTVATSDALDFELFWDPKRRRISKLTDSHQGVEILRFPVSHPPASQIVYPGLRRMLAVLSRATFVPIDVLLRIARFTPWIPSLWRWSEEIKLSYDLVAGMTIGFEPIMAAGQIAAKRMGAPFACYPLTHLGSGPEPGMDIVSRYYTMRHQIAVVKRSDRVIAQTPAEQGFYEAGGLSGQKFSVVGPGVDPSEVLGGVGDRFRSKQGIENPLVLAIGYLSRDKGAFDTVEAVRQLWHQGYKVDLALIGTISSAFRSFIDKLPASDMSRLHILGPVEDFEKKDALAAASMLSMPSRTDSFGITYLEAWLYGIPVIAARSWGVTDVVEDGKDGLVVPFGQVSSLAKAMKTLLDHPDEAKEMGERGRKKAYQEHLWDTKLSTIEAIYLAMVEEHNLKPGNA